MSDSALYLNLIFIITVLTMLVIALFVSYTKLLGKIKHLKLEHQKESQGQANTLLADATTTSLKILKETQQKADEILHETKSFKVFAEDLLKKQLASSAIDETQRASLVSQNFTADFEETLERMREKHVKLLEKALENIESQAQHALSDFKEIIEKETVASQKIIGQKIEDQYQNLRAELDTYKQNRLKKIEDSIYEILLRVSKEVLGKTLTLQNQEELVQEALQKAKKEVAAANDGETNF